MRKFLVLMIFPWMLMNSICASTYYLDPGNGSLTNNGSLDSPWPGLQEILDAGFVQTYEYSPLPYDPDVSQLVPKHVNGLIQPGDTIMLLNGLYGEVEIDRHYNESNITIMAAEGHHPILVSIRFRSCKNWTLDGLEINPEAHGYYYGHHLIFVESHGWRGPASEITIRNCVVTCGADAWDWTQEEWLARSSNGIYCNGNNILVENNHIENIDFGITLSGNDNQAINNQIINFSGDGIRPLGANILIENNVIKNCFDVNGNHDDGIQSFNLTGADFSNVIIRGNMIINHEDHTHPLAGTLQGIGCFDGPYDKWIVENNIVVVDHWHGISLYGAYDCKILNNTVIDPVPEADPGAPWVRINPHKDGTPSARCIMKNNIGSSFITDGTDASHNLALNTMAEYENHFLDVSNLDLRLRPGSSAIDAGTDECISDYDFFGAPRPQGEGVDIGAIEYAVSSIQDEGEKAFYIVPNPSSGNFTIQFPNEDLTVKGIHVYDVYGRACEHSFAQNGSEYQVQLTQTKPGYCFVVIEMKDRTFVHRIAIID